MSLFRRDPIDRWPDDLRAVADNSSDIEDMEKVGRTEYVLRFRDGNSATVRSDSGGLTFYLPLGSIEETSGRCGQTVSETCEAVSSMAPSVSIDMEDDSMHLSASISREDYDLEALMDLLFSWKEVMGDYRAALRPSADRDR